MAARDYGQYCGLARALDAVGDRWALLVVRDLLSGPHRFGELQTSLSRIPSNVLTNRLKELEAVGVVERVVLPSPARGTAYALTDLGRGLEPTLVALGRWGAPMLGEPREGEGVTAESFAMALRTTFRPESTTDLAGPVVYELHLGDLVVNARVTAGAVDVRTGPADTPDLVVRTDRRIKAVMAGEVTPAAALGDGLVSIDGDRAAWDRFPRYFAI